MLEEKDVEFIQEAIADTPTDGWIQLKVLCLYRRDKIGTIAYLNVAPGAQKDFPTAEIWFNHGAFLRSEALKSLNEAIAARFPSAIQANVQ